LQTVDSDPSAVPETMHAAVYRGQSVVGVEEIPTPVIGPGEILIRVEACGICHTDLKKIEHDLLAPPRVYGHETAGVVAAVGAGVAKYRLGDRVVAFHHIPCGECFYCRRKIYAQCPFTRSRHFGWLRAGGWRVCAVRAGNGLDCGTRRGEDTGRNFL